MQRKEYQHVNDLEDLAKTYGPAAQFSDFQCNEHIHYISADGKQLSGVIVWVQAATGDIGQRLVVAPDTEGAFLDFVAPGDVLQVEDVTQEPTLVRCHWCGQMHQANQVNECPLKPRRNDGR